MRVVLEVLVLQFLLYNLNVFLDLLYMSVLSDVEPKDDSALIAAAKTIVVVKDVA